MDLLKDKLVVKYFGTDENVSAKVLEAMQKPIKQWDLYLAVNQDGSVHRYVNTDESYCRPFGSIRLPDQFQYVKEKPLT